MKGRYVKVATKFWTDEKTIDLDQETKLLHLYILTSPHSNMAGYYRLPKAYIKADLKLSDKQLSKGFNELLVNGLIKYCEKSSVILIPNYYKYNTVQNKNQAKGATNRTSELPKNSLIDEYKKSINTYADSYQEELYKGLPKGFNKQLPEQSGNTEPEPELELELDSELDTDTELETEKENTSCSDSDPNDEIKFDTDSKPYKAAMKLKKLIKEKNNRQPVPDDKPEDMGKWSTSMDRTNRLGPPGGNKGYSWEEIDRLIEWCQQDEFWSGNILSAPKFREKIVKLENKMEKSSNNKSRKVVDF